MLALSRLVVVPGVPSNAAGFLLARSMKLLPPRWHTLVTWADTRHGHDGTLYRAANWEYAGLMRGSSHTFVDATGRQVAVKAKRTRSHAEMEALGYTRLPPAPKHKFIFRR